MRKIDLNIGVPEFTVPTDQLPAPLEPYLWVIETRGFFQVSSHKVGFLKDFDC